MIPDEIGATLFIVALVSAVICVGRLVWCRITKSREPEPETYGDAGGYPSPPLYGVAPCRPSSTPVKRGRVKVLPR